MTNEQAIKELQESHDIMRNHDIDESESYLMQALNMAIKALQEQTDNIPVMYYPQVDGITPTVVAQADGEKICGTCRNEDTYHCAECENKSDYEQAQADGEYISKTELLKAIDTWDRFGVDDTNSLFRLDNLSLPHYVAYIHYDDVVKCIKGMPSVAIPSAEPKTGHCKDCRYFEYDSVAKVAGIPLIVAHEICNKWGDGCKTSEDGYCFLFEPQESEDKE